MKIKLLFFLMLTALLSCEKDDDTNPNGDNNTETSLLIKTATPVANATIADNDDYNFQLECFVAEIDYTENATYELQVYLSGEGNSTYIDCGKKAITVTATEKSSYNISGQFLIISEHNSPYAIEIILYKYENTSTPFHLASAKITYN